MPPHGPYSVPIVLPCVSSPFLPGSPLHALPIVVPFVAFAASPLYDEPPVPPFPPVLLQRYLPAPSWHLMRQPHILPSFRQERPVAHRLPFSSRLRQQVQLPLPPLVSSYWPPTLHVGQPSELLHSLHSCHAPFPLLRFLRSPLSELPLPLRVCSGVPAWPDSSLSVCSPVPPVSRARPLRRQEISARPPGPYEPPLVRRPP